MALSRRRRAREEEKWVEEASVEEQRPEMRADQPTVHHEQPAIIGPSAFAWGNERSTASQNQAVSKVDGDDRMPGESWVQRAYRGPTPNNPSVSLRNRLKRAAFFDKREREVAAGRAERVEMDAGLPDAMVQERELEVA